MKKLLLICSCIAFLSTLRAQEFYSTASDGGTNGKGTISKFVTGANTLTAAFTFDYPDALTPQGSLMQASNGKLYGMTQSGGSNNVGVLFSFDPVTSTYTKLRDFINTSGGNPQGNLIQATDGKLYGMTNSGGANSRGVIFSFDPATSTYTKLKDLDATNGAFPQGSLIQATDGKLYGMTNQGGSNNVGVIFSFDPATSTYTKLKDFSSTDGSNPTGSLVQATDGKLYGMTRLGGSGSGGVIFSFVPATSTYAKLKDLDNTSGRFPQGNLIQATDGKLYGMTNSGGTGSRGVIFSLDPATATYTKLRDFVNASGGSPSGSLMQAADGKLYGMTSLGGGIGGAAGNGVIFSFVPATSTYTKLKDFGGTDGTFPRGNLIQATDGKLYGMTPNGGSSGAYGVVFSFVTATSTYAKLKDFGVNSTGTTVTGGLLKSTSGKFYGMTNEGGSNGRGVIYSYDPVAAVYTKLYDFDNTTGSNPYGSLMQAADGKLYGMTNTGGINNVGVIFSFDPATSTYTKLKDFSSTDGSFPRGSLMQAVDGKFYGMTNQGGSSSSGVVFSFDPVTSNYTKLKDFDGITAANPEGNLIQATDGKLYGMTNSGGNNSNGTIFSFDPVTSTYTNLKNFDGTDGSLPRGSLMQATNGKLYGMTYSGGTNSSGVIFSLDPAPSTYTKLKDLDFFNGVNPFGSLTQAVNGKLYGVTNFGGNSVGGVMFSFDPVTSTYTKLNEFSGTNGRSPQYVTPLETPCTTTTTYYKDADGDSYGDANNYIVECSQPTGYVTNNTDCNDNNATIHPGATEIPDDGIDQNCDGADLKTWYRDADGDGFGNIDITTTANTQPTGYVANHADCDDSKLLYADADGDGFGAGSPTACGVANNTDCNDTDASVHAPVTYYADNDGDGFGDLHNTTSACSAAPPAGYVANSADCDDSKLLYADNDGDGFGAGLPTACGVGNNTDCNDNDASVHAPVTYYKDADGDGFGDINNTIQVCSAIPPDGYVSNNSDCDDTKLLYTDADGDGFGAGSPVACGADNNTDCNDGDATVHTLQTYYADNDGDGFGDINNTISVCSSTPPPGYVANSADCDDNKLTYPDNDGDGFGTGSPVACGVTNNSDCNDNDASVHAPITYYKDNDGDGFGDVNITTSICSSTPPAGFVVNHTDCNDGDNTIFPGAPELCDGKDNDCDGTTDEGCTVPKIKINDVSITEGNSGKKALKFKVSLSVTSSKTITVNFLTMDITATAPSDYAAKTGTLTFNPGIKSRGVSVNIKGDIIKESDETFKVVLSNPVNATIKDNTGIGTILNDDGTAASVLTKDESSTRSMRVSPNPANGLINVQLKGYNGSVTLQLMDMLGKVLKEYKVQIDNMKYAQRQVDVSGVASGVYLMIVLDEKGYRQSQRVIVVH